VNTYRSISLHKTQSGVMLLEALIGILIFSLGILAMTGLQTMSITLATDARERAEAANFADQLVGKMWLNRNALANYVYTGVGAAPPALQPWIDEVNAVLPGSVDYPPTVQVGPATWITDPTVAAAGMQTTVTLRWKRPGTSDEHRFVMTAYIN
jgi:type IV pilus assembly protein PilV